MDGDTTEVDVEASFFFGGPLEGADVTWTAHAHPGSVSFDGYERFSFADFDFFQSSIFEEPLRASGEATTDSCGIARLEVPGVLRAGESTTVFDVSATVIDQSGQAIGGTASVTVHPAAVYAGIRTAEYLGRAGAPSEIQVASVDIDGEPAGGQPVTVEVYAREWVTVVEETDNGSRRYRSEPEDTLLETLSVTTGVDGLGSVSYTPSSSGVLRLVASTSDDAGRVASSAGYLWVSGQDFVRWEIRNDGIIELVADRDEYEVGDTAEVLVPAPFEGARALVTVERGGILQRETRVFEGNSETLSIPIVDGFVPNVFVSVVLYRPPTEEDPVPRYHVGYVELPVSTETRTLSVNVQPSVEQAGPGETVSYDIRVTDSTGAPVQAEVAVNMVDAAVLSLSDLEGPTGLQAFWFQRGLGVRTGASVSVSVDRANDTVREPAFGGKGGGEEGEALRSEFRNTAYWEAQLETNAQGVATFEVQLPDNLTTWRTQVRAVSGDTLVGEGTHDLLATKPLLVRPALPRFVRAGDQVMLRTLVRNATDDAQDVTVSIEVDGLDLDDGAEQTLTVQPGQSGEFDWPASASATGTATVAFRAAAPGLADAVEISLPVYLDVTPETMATGGVVVGESQLEALYLPPYAIVDNGELEVNVQGSLVGALHDELGKFASLPFEPSSRVASRVIGTVAAYLAEGEGGAGLVSAISFDMSKLQAMQRSDGGWGWCSGAGCRSDPMVTAWVLTAFGEAVEAGWDSPGTQWRRGDSYLRGHMNRTFDVRRPPDPNERAFMFYAIQHATDTSDYLNSLLALYENDRAALTAWGRAYLVLGLLEAGQPADDRAVRGLVSDLNASVIPSANGNHWEDP
ncbi:MAG: alpha-2-macroglobulin family protein, partial [Dehalococcoidia bacterium]